jgi:sporulation protein YlmC with PRC-barrel domain
VAFCAACLVLGAQAQNSSGTSGSSSDPSSSSSSTGSSTSDTTATPGSSGSSSSQSGWSGRNLSATGRMGHHELRASQLTGAQVTGSSGSQIGTISDTIINPASGRIDFAVISLSGAGTSGTSGSAASTTDTSGTSAVGATGTATAGSGKQVAVPWMLLRPSLMAGLGSSSATSSAGQQASFVFSGDSTKLQSAPNFDTTTDLTQPSWRQSVFSYFGLSGSGSAIGGAESPGSTGSSSGSTTSPDASGSSSSGSSSSSTTPNSGSSNP